MRRHVFQPQPHHLRPIMALPDPRGQEGSRRSPRCSCRPKVAETAMRGSCAGPSRCHANRSSRTAWTCRCQFLAHHAGLAERYSARQRHTPSLSPHPRKRRGIVPLVISDRHVQSRRFDKSFPSCDVHVFVETILPLSAPLQFPAAWPLTVPAPWPREKYPYCPSHLRPDVRWRPTHRSERWHSCAR